MLILHANRKENKVALTFDDGPYPHNTEKILDILGRYEVKATFFLIGKHVKSYPHIVKKIIRKGHLIGNHDYNHIFYKRNLKKSANEISKITKKYPHYMRPPYGNFLLYIPEILSKKIYVVLWDVSPNDWRNDKNKILNKVKNNTKNGSIILLHDNSKSLVRVLPRIIENLKKKYDLVRVDKMKF